MNRQILIWLLAPLALAAGSCQVPLVLIEQLFPEDKVPAQYKLPEKKVVLAFLDDVSHPLSYPPVKRAFADRANEILKEKKLAADVIGYDKLQDFQSAENDFNRLSVAEVGRKLGADLVIYCTIDDFHLKDTPVDMLWKGRIAGKVRVIDVRKGRLWPDESAGRPVQVSKPAAENPNESFGADLARVLGRELADEAIGLFHEHWVSRHKPPTPKDDDTFRP